MTDPFVLPRHRDAWHVIRGFVYQIDRTIEAWLDLPEGVHLVLEAGEDIDLVEADLLDPSKDGLRTLEQVKYREKRLTLRSPEVVEAIANFVDHGYANPGRELRFRFLTNAVAAQEIGTNIGPALDAWEELRRGTLCGGAETEAIEAIQSCLLMGSRPSSVSEESWPRLLEIVNSPPRLRNMISRFEWSLGNRNASSMRAHVIDVLTRRGTSLDVATLQYERLFFETARRLSLSGHKELRHEDLAVPLSLVAPMGVDAKLLSRLTAMSSAVYAELSAHGKLLGEHSRTLDGLATSVSLVTKQLAGASAYGSATSNVALPLGLARFARRQSTVQALERLLEAHAWVAMSAGLGMGKSEVARLLAIRTAKGVMWLRLRNLKPDIASAMFRGAIAQATGEPMTSDRLQWYRRSLTKLGDFLLVLDDLPRLDNDELGEELVLLTAACEASGTRIVSTSPYSLPDVWYDRAPKNTVVRHSLPAFDRIDTRELLVAYDAPAPWKADGRIDLLNGLTAGHPTLLVAATKYLQEREWRLGDAELTALLRREHAAEIVDQVTQTLRLSVADSDTLNLLHRLTLFSYPFDFKDVEFVARIPPAIDRVRERLVSVTGLWVQSDSANSYTVSPLIHQLGTSELLHDLRKKVEGLVALRISAHGPIGASQVVSAIGHFLAAEAFDQAAAMLIWALHEVDKKNDERGMHRLVSLWKDTALPKDVGLGYRILIRCRQSKLLERTGGTFDFVLRDLTMLIEASGVGEAWAVAVAFAEMHDLLAKFDYPTALSVFSKVEATSADARLPSGEPVEIPIAQGIWLLARDARTLPEFEKWLATIGRMSPRSLNEAKSETELYIHSAQAIADKLWLSEAGKPSGEQDWSAVSNLVTQLAKFAIVSELELLWGCAERALAIIEGEYKDNLQGAQQIVFEALGVASKDDGVQFVLQEVLGRQYLYAKDIPKAREWLDRACAIEWEELPVMRINALLAAGVAWDGDTARSREYIKSALELAQRGPRGIQSETIKSLGELAIVEWRGRDRKAAFEALNEAVRRWFEQRDDVSNAEGLFQLLGHVSGYFALVANDMELPSREDGRPYAEPFPGFFMTGDPTGKIAGAYKRERDSFVMYQLSQLAEIVGEPKLADEWALRAVEDARKNGQFVTILVSCRRIVRRLLSEGRIGDAFDLALLAGRISVASQIESPQGLLPANADIDAIVERNSAAPRAETDAALVLLLPLALRICQQSVSSSESVRAEGAEAVRVLKTFAETAALPQVWGTVAELIAGAIEGTTLPQELAQKASSLREQPGGDAVHVAGYLLASVSPRIDLKNAVRAQHAILKVARSNPDVERTLLVPFLSSYWQRAIAQERFNFSTPRLAVLALDEAKQKPIEDRAEAIIQAAASGLSVDLRR